MTIYPEEGNFPAIAKALLEVADDPSQVRYVSHPKAGFIVPEEVFARFEADKTDGDNAGEVEEVPRKRRPGRPRKQVSNPSKEE